MDERARRQQIEAYTRQLREGNPLMEDFVKERSSVNSKAYQARDLAEEALANEVMKNTSVPVPGKGSSRSKTEDFYNRILNETHPEISPDVQIRDLGDYEGEYQNGRIKVNKDMVQKQGLLKSLSGVLHEGGHQFDDKMLDFHGSDDVKYKDLVQNAPAKKLITEVDPAEAYELMSKGHHAKIPNLREGSFGLGGLKSMLKTGTFRAVPLIGTALGAAAALESGDVMAAVPGLDQAESVGESAESEKQALAEHDARVSYDKSDAFKDARRKAITKFSGHY